MSPKPNVGKRNSGARAYRSDLRRQQAEQTRERIVSAAAELFAAGSGIVDDVSGAWVDLLSYRYGSAFSAARRLAALLTAPEFLLRAGPVGMRSRRLMTVALRVMGNLVTPEDTDTVARLWRGLGTVSLRVDDRPPFAA